MSARTTPLTARLAPGNGTYSEGGLRIRFDIDRQPEVYTSRDPSSWGAISLGASRDDALVYVISDVEHFSLGLRGDGHLFAFDGTTYLMSTGESLYTSNPGPGMKHVEILLTGVGDDNPFDGVGSGPETYPGPCVNTPAPDGWVSARSHHAGGVTALLGDGAAIGGHSRRQGPRLRLGVVSLRQARASTSAIGRPACVESAPHGARRAGHRS